MKKKRISIFGSAFALCAALICSALLFSKTEGASAKAAVSDEETPYIIVYEKGEMKNVPEIDKDLLNDPKHNLMVNYIDDFDYSDSYVEEYALGDTRFDALLSDISIEVHTLVETKGDNIPTSFWNLTNNPYQYAIVNMKNYVYTDFYFNVDSEDCIAMSMGTLDSGGADIKILLYEVGSNNVVQQWTGDPQSIVGLGFCGLNQYKNYYVKFLANQADSVSGSGYIMHD